MPSSLAGSLTRPDLIFPELQAGERDAVLHEIAAAVAAARVVADGEALYRALVEREQLGSTGIGRGVALPHCKLKGLDHGIVAIGLARPGVDFGAPDGQPVSIFFLVLSPDDNPAEHLQILARVSRWVREDDHVAGLAALHGRTAVYDFLRDSL